MSFSIPVDDNVTIDIYNQMGRRVNKIFDSNVKQYKSYVIDFNTGSLANGVYYGILKTSTYQKVIKLVLVK
ncbi:MAG: hypothetical protein COA97_11505 [Flavobacteriales bacterium]|nr:MAG: hypothetical protein COA97_11505 [Flavobacteriales bacterium]